MPVHADAAKKAIKARKAYDRMLSSIAIEWGEHVYPTEDLRFFCGDMNRDGVPELLVENKVAFEHEGLQRIFTYRNGEVQCIYVGAKDSRIVRYYPKKSIFIEEANRKGWSLIKYCRLRKKRAVLVAQEQRPDDYMTLSYGTVYRIKNKKVLKAAFNKKIREVKGKGNGKRICLRRNTAENRNIWIKP